MFDRLEFHADAVDQAMDSSRPDEVSQIAHVAAAGIQGLQAGVVATVIMTAFRLPIMRSLPPSSNFWSQYVAGGDPDDHLIAGLGLHFVYGSIAGAIFGTLFALQNAERSFEAEHRGLVWGAVYGMMLSAFGSQVMLKELLDIRLDSDELALFHAGHLVYGLSLGAWVGSRTEGVEDPEVEYEYGDGN